MSLADQIINKGFLDGLTAAEVAELRDELVAARALAALLERFETCAVYSFGPTLDLHCTRCHRWSAHIDGPHALAELARRAGEHAEVCR